jgi:hypothetical protein
MNAKRKSMGINLFLQYLKNINLDELLQLEKDRRGIEKDKLVFVGMANIANYYWCAMKSIIHSRKNELEFFGAYLEDRIYYSYLLGLIDKLPESKEKLLDIGDDIKFSDIEKLLEEKTKEFYNTKNVATMPNAIMTSDRDGNKIMIINPNLSPEMKSLYEDLTKKEGAKIVNIEEHPIIRGEFLHEMKAEKYPTIRWNFEWEDYVIVGVPDGITNEFVYEFKTTRNEYLMKFVKPVAFAQADLYGYFFRRNRKRVQIYVTEKGEIKTWNEDINKDDVLNLLKKFKDVDNGCLPLPPKPWKCKVCEVKNECILRQNR